MPHVSSETDEHHLTLPPAPRPLTPRARRRSWSERRVRMWVIPFIGIGLIAGYFAAYYAQRAWHERRLISHGIPVIARIRAIDQFNRPGRSFTRDQPRLLRVTYEIDGKQYGEHEITIPVKLDHVIQVYNPESPLPKRDSPTDTIALRVDPNDHLVATAQTDPPSWLASLVAPALLAAVSLLLAGVAVWQRNRVLDVWKDGAPIEGTIVDWHRSAIAPRSVVMRYTVQGSDDRRVFSTLWPHTAGDLVVGDPVALIAPPGQPKRAVVAELYC